MQLSAVVRELIAAGLSGEMLVAAIERIEATSAPAERTARQERNARYYQRRVERPSGNEWGNIRINVLKRDSFTCVYCGGKGTEVDHIVPLIQGGSNDPSNLAAACKRCNSSKAGQTPEQWNRKRGVS